MYYSRPKRNSKQCLCIFLGGGKGQIWCIMGNVEVAYWPKYSQFQNEAKCKTSSWWKWVSFAWVHINCFSLLGCLPLNWLIHWLKRCLLDWWTSWLIRYNKFLVLLYFWREILHKLFSFKLHSSLFFIFGGNFSRSYLQSNYIFLVESLPHRSPLLLATWSLERAGWLWGREWEATLWNSLGTLASSLVHTQKEMRVKKCSLRSKG